MDEQKEKKIHNHLYIACKQQEKLKIIQHIIMSFLFIFFAMSTLFQIYYIYLLSTITVCHVLLLEDVEDAAAQNTTAIFSTIVFCALLFCFKNYSEGLRYFLIFTNGMNILINLFYSLPNVKKNAYNESAKILGKI